MSDENDMNINDINDLNDAISDLKKEAGVDEAEAIKAAAKDIAARETVQNKGGIDMDKTNINEVVTSESIKASAQTKPKWRTRDKVFYALGTIFAPGAFNLGHLAGKKMFEAELQNWIEANYKK